MANKRTNVAEPKQPRERLQAALYTLADNLEWQWAKRNFSGLVAETIENRRQGGTSNLAHLQSRVPGLADAILEHHGIESPVGLDDLQRLLHPPVGDFAAKQIRSMLNQHLRPAVVGAEAALSEGAAAGLNEGGQTPTTIGADLLSLRRLVDDFDSLLDNATPFPSDLLANLAQLGARFERAADLLQSEGRLVARGVDVIESKPNHSSNPLLTEPEIHPNLKPLFEAMVMVSVWSEGIARCYPEMLALKESSGLPKSHEWPGSPMLEQARAEHAAIVEEERDKRLKAGEPDVCYGPYVEPRWTELMREWSGYYRDWCTAIATAKQAAKSPAVAAIMDAGEARPAHRWTTQTIIDLDNLAGTLHPMRTCGPDGMGVFRCGLPPLPAAFYANADEVAKRKDELRSIPVSAGTPTPTVSAPADLLGTIQREAPAFERGSAGQSAGKPLEKCQSEARELLQQNRVLAAKTSGSTESFMDLVVRHSKAGMEHGKALSAWHASGAKGDTVPSGHDVPDPESNDPAELDRFSPDEYTTVCLFRIGRLASAGVPDPYVAKPLERTNQAENMLAYQAWTRRMGREGNECPTLDPRQFPPEVARRMLERVEELGRSIESDKPQAPPVRADECAGPALTLNQSRVLQAMARCDTSRLLSSKMIAEEMDSMVRLSEETVRQCVVKLIGANLAERPEGDRSGARLTNGGRKLAGKIAD